MQPAQDQIVCETTAVGLQVTTAKTKFTNLLDPSSCMNINGDILGRMLHFKYPDSAVLPNNQARNEVRFRVDCSREAFLSLRKELWSRTKLHIYLAAVHPVSKCA